VSGGRGDFSPADEVTPDQIIQDYKQLIRRAHARRRKIYGATLTPIEGFLVPGIRSPQASRSRRFS
jgi:hypothetical protein